MFSIKRMVERAVERAVNIKEHNQEVQDTVETTCLSKVTVYNIANGYLVSGDSTRPTYCADHVAVAEFIVAQATRNKMGVGTQMDLFENSKANPCSNPIHQKY